MPFPQASKALDRFTVLDLTRVRSGPTCVRQLADWGANVIKIEMPPDEAGGDAPGGPREGFDFQNLHRNKRSMTLNLKSKEGRAAFLQHGRRRPTWWSRTSGPTSSSGSKIDYKDLAQGQPAHRLRQHLRLRPDRALRERGRASTRSRRAWAG